MDKFCPANLQNWRKVTFFAYLKKNLQATVNSVDMKSVYNEGWAFDLWGKAEFTLNLRFPLFPQNWPSRKLLSECKARFLVCWHEVTFIIKGENKKVRQPNLRFPNNSVWQCLSLGIQYLYVRSWYDEIFSWKIICHQFVWFLA